MVFNTQSYEVLNSMHTSPDCDKCLIQCMARSQGNQTIDPQQSVNGKYHFNENNRNTSFHCITRNSIVIKNDRCLFN